MNRKKMLRVLTLTSFAALGVSSLTAPLNIVNASEGYDVISQTQGSEWFQNEDAEGQGTWTPSGSSLTVDSFGGKYAMEGATYISPKGEALGAYEFTTKIVLTELNNVQNPMVGIIPWYIDSENYLFVQLKFTNDSKYMTTQAERTDGYAIEQVIFSGKLNGESKFNTATGQQENTVFDALTTEGLKNNKVNPLSNEGHTISVRFDNNTNTGINYKVTISYNGVTLGAPYAYYYNAITKNNNVGFMAQDVKATFSEAKINDFVANENNYVLGRDWMEKEGYTYRTLNGVDTWTFNQDESVTIDAKEIKNNSRPISNYEVSGTNIAGYDTNRGYVENPYKENEKGLPQNYEVSATFKLDESTPFKSGKDVSGYGLLAWYKDDQNFVDVTIRRTVTGLAAAPMTSYEVVLFGWLECSSSTIGQNVYKLTNFDPSVNHTLKVQKKSTGFYVYLDDGTEPIITKNVKGTETNYSYGYEGYNCKFTASKISSKPIYESYDEISVLDENENTWRVAGSSESAWVFEEGKISTNAKETSNEIGNRSYVLGTSDISDINMSVEVKANVSLGDGFAELMLSPWMIDENNYARIGLVWKNGKTYARLRTSTYTEEDIDNDVDPKVTLREVEIDNIDISKEITVKAEKINETIALYVNDTLIYGKEIKDIKVTSEDYGMYIYNMDIEVNSFTTEGYKKYTTSQVGDWLTSGMKYNEWTITEEGYLAGDGTYTKEMSKDDKDGEKNWAIKENTIGDDYEMTVDIIATAQSEAEDRVGVVMWYVDEDNFMLFYLDRWRADSTVPRTTIYGKINGETLPTTYNHGGWLKEGETPLEEHGGKTQTELSQVTEWHTVKVIKEGNNFTCYVDNDTNGYISYTVEAGLPNTEGKTVYSGVYTFNDAVLVRSYDVTEIGGFTTPTLPCEPNNPYNASVSAPELGTYNDVVFIDEFDNILDNSGSEAPDNPGGDIINPGTSEDPNDGNEGDTPSSGGCFASVTSVTGLVATLAAGLLGITVYRRKKEEK